MQAGEKIGIGATAELYDLGEGRVYKKFRSDLSDDVICMEYEITKTVQGQMIRVPKLYELVLENEQHGYVMEKLCGKSLMEEFESHLGKPDFAQMLEELCTKFASLHYQMHQIKGLSLDDGHEWLKRRISWSDELEDKEKEALYQRLYSMPKGQSLCHNDYHPGNLIIDHGEFCVIDWCDAASGNPWMDVARTVLVFSSVNLPDGIPEEDAIQLNKGRKQLKDVYLQEYLRLAQTDDTEVRQWMPIVAASRLCFEHGKDKEMLLKMVKDSLNS